MRGLGRSAPAVLLLLAACGAQPPARLEIGAVTVDPPGGEIGAAVARVELRNGGGRDLLLHAARFECGCRLGAALPDALAPGASTSLVVRCRGGDAGAGPRAVRVLSSDPERPESAVQLPLPPRATAVFAPRALYFGYVPVGGTATRDVTVSPGQSDVGITADPPLAIEQRPPRADGARVIRVHFSPVTAGVFRGALTVGDRGDVLSVTGVGHGSILAFPAELTLPSAVTAGGPPAIALKAVGDAPVEITAMDLPDGLSGELQTTTAGREVRIVLRPRGGRVAMPAAIRIHTTAADEPLLVIPLRDGAG